MNPNGTNAITRTLVGLDAVHAEKVRNFNRRQNYQNNAQKSLEVNHLSSYASNVNSVNRRGRGRGRTNFHDFHQNNRHNNSRLTGNQNQYRDQNFPNTQSENPNAPLLPDISRPPPNYDRNNSQINDSQNSMNLNN